MKNNILNIVAIAMGFLITLNSNIAMGKPEVQKNINGNPLTSCSNSPLTGFYRNGKCETGSDDEGTHVICARVTKKFLEFSYSRGNDLISENKMYHFPGLKPGDRWCLCALRWKEAYDKGVAPPIDLKATHQSALKFFSKKELQEKSLVSISSEKKK